MVIIYNLLFFILGIIFIKFIIPLFEEITDVILTKLEVFKVKDSETINLTNIKIQNALDSSHTETRIIGFASSDNQTEEEQIDD